MVGESQMKRLRLYPKIWLVWLFILIQLPQKSLGYQPAALLVDFSHINPGQKTWHKAWAAGFGIALPLSPRLAFYINFGHWRFHVSSRDKKLFEGTLNLSPLSSGFYFLIFPQKMISPLLALGGGYFFSDYQVNRERMIMIPEIIKLNQKVKGSLSWQWGGGVVIRISKKADIWFQMERHQTSLSVETIIEDLNLGLINKREKIPFHPLIYRLGFQFNLF